MTIETTELAPSQVRKIILEGHELIRSKLRTLESVTHSSETNNTIKLLSLTQEFAAIFLDHLCVEERILRPILAEIDAWGAVRIQKMDEEHREQRNQIKSLEDLILRNDLTGLKRDLHKLIGELYVDMESEERDFLHPDVLRDDVISIHTSSG